MIGKEWRGARDLQQRPRRLAGHPVQGEELGRRHAVEATAGGAGRAEERQPLAQRLGCVEFRRRLHRAQAMLEFDDG